MVARRRMRLWTEVLDMRACHPASKMVTGWLLKRFSRLAFAYLESGTKLTVWLKQSSGWQGAIVSALNSVVSLALPDDFGGKAAEFRLWGPIAFCPANEC